MARNRGPKRAPQPKKPPLTHFLCLPLVTLASKPQLEASLARFNAETSPEAEEDGRIEGGRQHQTTTSAIPAKAIRPLGSLHCTLGVMSLDKDQLSEAVEYLKGDEVLNLLRTMEGHASPSKHAQPSDALSVEGAKHPPKSGRGPLEISMTGLASMHAVQQTSILYSEPVDEAGRLYPFCVTLQNLFKEKGFLVEDNRQLKLHVTIVNTIYAKGRKSAASRGSKRPSSDQNAASSSNNQSVSGHGPNANAPLRLDATSLLEKYKDFTWAENIVLDRVAICEMGAKKVVNDEGEETGAEYTEVATIPLRSASSVP